MHLYRKVCACVSVRAYSHFLFPHQLKIALSAGTTSIANTAVGSGECGTVLYTEGLSRRENFFCLRVMLNRISSYHTKGR